MTSTTEIKLYMECAQDALQESKNIQQDGIILHQTETTIDKLLLNDSG